jgi:arylamine N-acetyltransferase
LYRNHLIYIPVETYSNKTESPLEFDINDLFCIIRNDRGGEGLQLNYLFYTLLSNLGFSVELYRKEQKNDSMLVKVAISNNSYILDVGSGFTFISPIELKMDAPQMILPNYYRVNERGEFFVLEVSRDLIEFKSLFKFKPVSLQPIEFLNEYNLNFADTTSHETKAFRYTKNGYIHLTPEKLTSMESGQLNSSTVLNSEEFESKFDQHFRLIT